MKTAIAIITILLSATSAYAESRPLESFNPVEMLKSANKSEADQPWVIRILNTQALANYQTAAQAGEWCGARGSSTSKDSNPDACAFYGRLAKPAEEAISGNIKMTQTVISYLKSQPRSKENTAHLQVLETQLATFEKLPTPFSDFMIKKALGQ